MKRVDTQRNEPINQNSLKVPKVVKPTKKKRNYKTLGTSVINSTLSPFLLFINHEHGLYFSEM